MIPLNHYEPAELKANWPPQRVWVAAVFFLRGSNSLSRGTLSGSHFGDVFRCNRGISQTWTRFPPHVMFVGGSEPVKSRVWTSSEHYPITCCGPIFPTARSVFVGGWSLGGVVTFRFFAPLAHMRDVTLGDLLPSARVVIRALWFFEPWNMAHRNRWFSQL